MKSLRTFIAVSFLVISLTGCGGGFETTQVGMTEISGPTLDFAVAEGDRLLREGTVVESAEFWRSFTEKFPDHWFGYYYRGMISNHIGEYSRGLQSMKIALNRESGNPVARGLIYSGMGDSYRLMGQFGRAQIEYRMALNLDPECQQARQGESAIAAQAKNL